MSKEYNEDAEVKAAMKDMADVSKEMANTAVFMGKTTYSGISGFFKWIKNGITGFIAKRKIKKEQKEQEKSFRAKYHGLIERLENGRRPNPDCPHPLCVEGKRECPYWRECMLKMIKGI